MTSPRLTRDQILKDYVISSDGRILTRGAFHMEMLYIPYYWCRFLDRDFEFQYVDRAADRWYGYHPTDAEKEEFPEIGRNRTIMVRKQAKAVVSAVFLSYRPSF